MMCNIGFFRIQPCGEAKKDKTRRNEEKKTNCFAMIDEQIETVNVRMWKRIEYISNFDNNTNSVLKILLPLNCRYLI